jgi:hypothetical protein
VSGRKMAKLYRATKVSSGTVMDFLISEDEVETYRRAGYTITAPKESELKRLIMKKLRR